MDTGFLYCILGGLALVSIAALASAIRIVQEYERLIVFRLGRCMWERGPGLVLLFPFMERGVKVDLREQVREIPHQTSNTVDNVPIAIDFLLHYKVVEAMQSVLQVVDFESAIQSMATTTLRSVIGDIMLDEVLSQREHLNQMLRTKLNEVTERWGVKVTHTEIREITLLREFQGVMKHQMTVEQVRSISNGVAQHREFSLNDAPRQVLCKIIQQHGISLCNHPRNCEGLLRDMCGEHSKEIYVLVAALKEGIASDLLGSQTDIPQEVLLARLTKQLTDDLALIEEAARWAVESWALALGIISS